MPTNPEPTSLKLQRTTVTQTSDGVRVQVLLADDLDPDAASGTILIDLPVQLTEGRPLLEYRSEALSHAQRAIDKAALEIQRLHKEIHK